MQGPWKVVVPTADELEGHRNALSPEGSEDFSVLPVGKSEMLSRLPREHKSLEQRTTFAIVAQRPPV